MIRATKVSTKATAGPHAQAGEAPVEMGQLDREHGHDVDLDDDQVGPGHRPHRQVSQGRFNQVVSRPASRARISRISSTERTKVGQRLLQVAAKGPGCPARKGPVRPGTGRPPAPLSTLAAVSTQAAG